MKVTEQEWAVLQNLFADGIRNAKTPEDHKKVYDLWKKVNAEVRIKASQ